MLDAYVGEFLVSPIPLELSLNTCSFACPYCFANLNVRTRVAPMTSIRNLLHAYPQRTSLAARWLQRGAAVCVSNRVDPFAPSNRAASHEVFALLRDVGIGVQLQTRGPHHHKHLAAMLPLIATPSVWYLSIECWDETVRRRVTPGAPKITTRLATIDTLRAAGHVVVVGINPCVPEWLPLADAHALLDALVARGVHGVWIERLHFSPPQRTAMTDAERAQIGPQILARASKRHTDPRDRAHLDAVRAAATERGLAIFSVGQPTASTFFDPYHRIYPSTIPTMQDFINFCHAHYRPNQLIPFHVFADFFTRTLPSGVWPIDSYVGASTRSAFRSHQIPTTMSFHDLLAILYQEPRYKLCPARLPSFAYAGTPDGKGGWIQLVDPTQMPYLIWSPTGHTERIVSVETAVW